jgi:hypothetical protein
MVSSLTCSLQKGLQVALGGRDSQQRAPDAELRQRVVDLRLRQQPLGVRYFNDGPQASAIASQGLAVCGRGSIHLHGNIVRYLPGTLGGG